MEGIEGISFGGFNITDLRYADDAMLVADKRKKLQKMIDKLNDNCKEYGMDINVKKTKVMVLGGDRVGNGSQVCLTLDGVPLEQVTPFKYLGSWISEDARCEEDIRARVGMATAAFWQNKEVMRGNIRLSTKLKILNSYVFSIASYGCESWTWNKKMRQKVDALEMWCYRKILKINFRDRIRNKDVLSRMHTELHFMRDMMKRKMKYAGHVLRGSAGVLHLQILEGQVEGIRKQGRPRDTWFQGMLKWSGKKYGELKWAAKDGDRWKLMVVNLRIEDDR